MQGDARDVVAAAVDLAGVNADADLHGQRPGPSPVQLGPDRPVAPPPGLAALLPARGAPLVSRPRLLRAADRRPPGRRVGDRVGRGLPVTLWTLHIVDVPTRSLKGDL